MWLMNLDLCQFVLMSLMKSRSLSVGSDVVNESRSLSVGSDVVNDSRSFPPSLYSPTLEVS